MMRGFSHQIHFPWEDPARNPGHASTNKSVEGRSCCHHYKARFCAPKNEPRKERRASSVEGQNECCIFPAYSSLSPERGPRPVHIQTLAHSDAVRKGEGRKGPCRCRRNRGVPVCKVAGCGMRVVVCQNQAGATKKTEWAIRSSIHRSIDWIFSC